MTEQPIPQQPMPQQEQQRATLAAVLYLANLLVVPGLAFVALLLLFFRWRPQLGTLARRHFHQAIGASAVAGVLLVLLAAIMVWLGGWQQPGTWVVLILYLTTCHAALVLLGVLVLVRALNAQPPADWLPRL